MSDLRPAIDGSLAVSGAAAPLVTGGDGSLGSGLTRAGIAAAGRVSRLITPWPTAMLLRRAFAASGAATAETLARHAPDGIESLVDQPYGHDADMVLDLHRPATDEGSWSLVVWIHGGAFVGGSTDELAGRRPSDRRSRLRRRRSCAVYVAPARRTAPENGLSRCRRGRGWR
jgi:acetyl esterase/lipase